jgi:uncharacterized protein involved in cysteine biosynthesis
MDWTQVLTMITVICGFFWWFFSRLDRDINILSSNLDGWTKHLVAMQAEQSKRTDELYNVILRMLEEKK